MNAFHSSHTKGFTASIKEFCITRTKVTEILGQGSYRFFKTSRLCTNPDMSLSVINGVRLECQTK